VSDQVNDDKPQFVGKRERSRVITLDDPIRFKGKVYEKITVRRLTGAQVADWSEAVRDKKDADLGNVVDEEGNPVPKEVLDSLDADDDQAVGEAISDFLPRQFSKSLDSGPETPASS
jgi:hypothetical protein